MNHQKTPLARTLPLFAQNVVLNEIEKRGYALPGHVVKVSGSIVTVAFDVADANLPQVTIPVLGPEYIRLPIQVGDKGVAFPASVPIGNVSGLGAAAANPNISVVCGNLSTLIWFPVGSANFSATPDANALVLYGPDGVIIKDKAGNTVATLTSSGWTLTAPTTIQMTVGSKTLKITSSGIFIDGETTDFLAHTHSGVQTGGGTSGPVNSP